MKVIALVDNARIPQRKDLRPEAGLALCIFANGQQIIFDTGVSGVFHMNAQRLGVDVAQADLAVISHHHFDHGGGIKAFLEANRHARIFLRSSRTERFDVRLFGLFWRYVGLDETLFRRYPERLVLASQSSEIAPGVFVLTAIERQHPTPVGNRHLFMVVGDSRQPDDFEHELVLVVRQGSGLVVFTGCSHRGILNILDAVVAQFPGQSIKAVFGGFHLIDMPVIDNMAGTREDVEELGQALLKYPVEKFYTGHCTGQKAYRILKQVAGPRLDYFATGNQAEI